MHLSFKSNGLSAGECAVNAINLHCMRWFLIYFVRFCYTSYLNRFCCCRSCLYFSSINILIINTGSYQRKSAIVKIIQSTSTNATYKYNFHSQFKSIVLNTNLINGKTEKSRTFFNHSLASLSALKYRGQCTMKAIFANSSLYFPFYRHH